MDDAGAKTHMTQKCGRHMFCDASDSWSRKILLRTKDINVSSRACDEPRDSRDPKHGGRPIEELSTREVKVVHSIPPYVS